MGRRHKPLEDSLRWELLQEYIRYAKSTPTIPNPHTFWKNVLPGLGYPMAWGTFQREWERLRADGLIKIDQRTGAPIIVGLRIIEHDDISA